VIGAADARHHHAEVTTAVVRVHGCRHGLDVVEGGFLAFAFDGLPLVQDRDVVGGVYPAGPVQRGEALARRQDAAAVVGADGLVSLVEGRDARELLVASGCRVRRWQVTP
jgi:hydrogenase maturation factor HypF (carbamoyltransferase family)